MNFCLLDGKRTWMVAPDRSVITTESYTLFSTTACQYSLDTRKDSSSFGNAIPMTNFLMFVWLIIRYSAALERITLCGNSLPKIPRRCDNTKGGKLENRPKVAKIATIPNDKFVIWIEYSGRMDETPTFPLPNQFLVWVARKFLDRSDLDLLLTEYYKERLESQLKNRETHMNEDNSTESTGSRIPTHLPVSIDWIPPLKPSPKRPPFSLPTPLSSPLSLPSLSIPSIPSVSCYNNNTCPSPRPYVTEPTFFKSNLPPSPHPPTCINQEVMATNTPNTESTSVGS